MAINSINTVTAAAAASTQTTTKQQKDIRDNERQILPRQLPVSFMRRVLTPGQTRLPIKQQARPTTQRSLQLKLTQSSALHTPQHR